MTITQTNNNTPISNFHQGRGGAAVQNGVVAVYMDTKLSTPQAISGAQKCLKAAGASFVVAKTASFFGSDKISMFANTVGTISTVAGLVLGAKAVQLHTEDHKKLIEENEELKKSLNTFSHRALESRQPSIQSENTAPPTTPPSSRRR